MFSAGKWRLNDRVRRFGIGEVFNERMHGVFDNSGHFRDGADCINNNGRVQR